MTRSFLVGCPRSGTTLLQALLAAHPDVISFPETFFFAKVVPAAPERWRRHLGLASQRAPGALDDLDALSVTPDPRPSLVRPFTVDGYARCFVRRMDAAARSADATLWLEKTPSHARHISWIEQTIPDVRVVHLVRAGEAVAASLRDASIVEPSVWPHSTPLQLVQVWRRYLGYSEACVGRENHAFVSYERLVEHTGEVMLAVLEFLSLAADKQILDGILAGYRASSEKVTGRLRDGATRLEREPWKHDVAGDIVNRNAAKFQRLFTESERAEIETAVAREQDAAAALPYL